VKRLSRDSAHYAFDASLPPARDTARLLREGKITEAVARQATA
jgi:hypothetical protein